MIFKDISNKIVVLIKLWKIIMSPISDSNEGDLVRIQFLQCLTMPDGYEPIPGAVNNIGMTFHVADPFVRPHVVA